ncbi:MAG: hypothetical protein IJA55_10390 [Clostridia bacterium]|nr:hypothetical protein [Clostridia bacterium]
MKAISVCSCFKSFVIVLLCISMLFSLASCSGKKTTDESETVETPEESAETCEPLPEVEEEPVPDFAALMYDANCFTVEMMFAGNTEGRKNFSMQINPISILKFIQSKKTINDILKY